LSQAVILAGGLGTRLRPFTENNPKPMIPVCGRPFLDRLLEQVRDQGISRVLLLLGYLPDIIMDHVGDGSRFGLEVTYSISDVNNDTGRRLKLARPMLDDHFLLMYCDNFLPVDVSAMWHQYKQSNTRCQITVYANDDGYTKDNLRLDAEHMVETYDKTRQAEDLEGVDIGYAIVARNVVDALPEENVNFEACAYPALIEERRLGGFLTGHRYYSIGSHERLPQTERFFAHPRAIILDRDGVLNVKQPRACYVTTPEQFQWIPGSREAVKLFTDAGYLIFLITNQAGIARGVMTEDDLERVHATMLADLRDIGANIDAIYYCPHGWDEGCSCRKPAPGMLFTAQREFDLNLQKAVFIGDDERDMEAGLRAGCPSILVTDDIPLIEVARHLLESNRNPHEKR